jgi:hypothetical protein
MAEGGGDDSTGDGDAPNVFISYASQDAAVANALVEALELSQLRCWIAPRDVIAGSLYAEAIVRALNEAKVFVLVLSAHACASPHVGKEIERASAKRRPIIALRADSEPLSPAFEYYLSESQWIDLGSGLTDAMATTLVDAVRRHLHPAAAAALVVNQDLRALHAARGRVEKKLGQTRRNRLDRRAALRIDQRPRQHEILR